MDTNWNGNPLIYLVQFNNLQIIPLCGPPWCRGYPAGWGIAGYTVLLVIQGDYIQEPDEASGPHFDCCVNALSAQLAPILTRQQLDSKYCLIIIREFMCENQRQYVTAWTPRPPVWCNGGRMLPALERKSWMCVPISNQIFFFTFSRWSVSILILMVYSKNTSNASI